MLSDSKKDSTVVNRYTGSALNTGTTTPPVINRSTGKAVSSDSKLTPVPTGHRPQSSIDPAQFLTSTQSRSSTRDTAVTTAQRNAGFSAPPPFTGLSLDHLQSQHEVLNRIAFTPQWRDNTPAAIANLRRLLPADPPPAYQLLTWACDQFAAFTRSGSCGDSTALMDVLHALQTLIQDAQHQPESSPPPEDASSPPPKRQRRDSTAKTTQVDTRPEPLLDSPVSQLESHLKALEDIPADAEDWSEQADPITKKILATLQHDERLDPGHHVHDACLVFDMLGSRTVGNDVIRALREVMRSRLGTASTAPKEQMADAAPGLPDETTRRSHEPTAEPATQTTAPRSVMTTTAVPMPILFCNATEAAVYEVLRRDPMMVNTELHQHPRLSDFKSGAITIAASVLRPYMAFGIPTEKFLKILQRMANSNGANGFVRSLVHREKMALDTDLFEDLNRALVIYRLGHENKLPGDEKEAASLARYLPQNTTTAAIWTAAACPNQACTSREQALARWKNDPTDDAGSTAPSHAALQVGGNAVYSNRPFTVDQAVLQYPWVSNERLSDAFPELRTLNAELGAHARDLLAYSLPDVNMVLKVIAIAESANDVQSFLTALDDAGLGMNQHAFPDWKIALQSYKSTHENRIPSSTEDLKDFVKCIRPSQTAAPVYFAADGSQPYCQLLSVATRDWRAREPSKFAPLKGLPLPDSVWP